MNCNFAIELTNHPHPPVTDDYDDDGTLVRANWDCSYLSIANDNSPRVSNIGKNENRQNWWWPTTSPVVLWLMLPRPLEKPLKCGTSDGFVHLLWPGNWQRATVHPNPGNGMEPQNTVLY